MSNIEFADGLYFYEPSPKAPDFVVGNMAIQRSDFIKWLERQDTDDKGRVRLAIKRSKNGNVYVALDDFKPHQGKPRDDVKQRFDDEFGATDYQSVPVDDDSIPFRAAEDGWLV